MLKHPRSPVVLAALFAVAIGCGTSEEDEAELVYSFELAPVEVGPFEETDTLCQSIALNNDDKLWINAVVMKNGGAVHHSNWYFVPEDAFGAPADGTWPCSDYDFDQTTAALLGGVLSAQSTQAREETQGFPAGAAFDIPPHSRLIGNLHLLNATDATVTTGLEFELHTIPRETVEARLSPMILDYGAAKGSDSSGLARNEGECTMLLVPDA